MRKIEEIEEAIEEWDELGRKAMIREDYHAARVAIAVSEELKWTIEDA